MNNNDLEFWLQGTLPGIIALLQPVAHALLQAEKEINETMRNFPDDLLWQMPAGLASPAFHLQHITGILDRLFTYADGKQLTDEQLIFLSKEGKKEEVNVSFLLNQLNKRVNSSIQFLKQTTTETLTEARFVGRKQIPSTQLGLLFHAAEHTMRHTGQLLVTQQLFHKKKMNNNQFSVSASILMA